MPGVYALAGFILLFVGGETVLKGATATARKLGVSPLLIGLTIISIGTSLPELVVSAQAAVGGHTDVALGNIIGSNTANILLMIGATGLMTPLVYSPSVIKRDGMGVAFITLLFFTIFYIPQPHLAHVMVGVVALALLVGFMGRAYFSEKRKPGQNRTEETDLFGPTDKPTALYVLMLLGGIAAVVLGADLFVTGAIEIARMAGVSEAVIGLTMVALGTSLPELATIIPAARKGQTDIIVGNILGSNTFNMLGVGGVVSLIGPIHPPQEILDLDLPFMLGVTLLFISLAWRFPAFPKKMSLLFLITYFAYIAFKFIA